MKNYTVFFYRNETSPISYLSGLTPNFSTTNITVCEKERDFIKKDSGFFSFNKPVIKGSHTRGRFRNFLSNEIMQNFEGKIDDVKFLVFIAKILFSGSVTNEKLPSDVKTNLTMTSEIANKNEFFKNFGAMITFLNSAESNCGIGHLYPLVVKNSKEKDSIINKAEDLNLKVVYASNINEEETSLKLKNGNDYKITTPFFKIETNRVTDKLWETEKYGRTEEEMELIRQYYKEFTQTEKGNGETKDTNKNILYNEVIAPVVDFYENIRFLDDDVDTHLGILTGYKKYFTEIKPYIGGKVANFFGAIDSVYIFDENMQEIKYDEDKYFEFIQNSNPAEFQPIFKSYNEIQKKNKDKKEKEKSKKKEEKENQKTSKGE